MGPHKPKRIRNSDPFWFFTPSCCTLALHYYISMLGSRNHIVNLGLTLTVIITMIAGSSVALADKAKSVKQRSAVSASTRLNTPGLNAVDAVVTALGQKASSKAKTNGANDTSKTESRIVSVHATSDVITAKIDLATEQPQVDVAIFNMLGKRMSEIYRGPASRGEHEYVSSISDLPEGVYICILQGSNFRRAEKFYLSR